MNIVSVTNLNKASQKQDKTMWNISFLFCFRRARDEDSYKRMC